MKLSVQERAASIATFRFIEVKLMELVAAWTPSTPEMEVKVMFGRHIWDFAQHADILGKRTFELRLPEQHSRRPVEKYAELLQSALPIRGTGERLATLYDGIVPGHEARYRTYLSDTDPVLDEPSIVLIDRILRDLERQRAEAHAMQKALTLPTFDPKTFIVSDRAIANVVAPS
ncbi:MAG: hypothetical protein M3041_12690 [Acidobacteriota bacterium]|nr:hypothetical protein [Acidobacteriota bacterium]